MNFLRFIFKNNKYHVILLTFFFILVAMKVSSLVKLCTQCLYDVSQSQPEELPKVQELQQMTDIDHIMKDFKRIRAFENKVDSFKQERRKELEYFKELKRYPV